MVKQIKKLHSIISLRKLILLGILPFQRLGLCKGKGLIISQKRKEKLFAKKEKKPSVTNDEHFKIYNTTYNKLRRAAKQLYHLNRFSKFVRKLGL